MKSSQTRRKTLVKKALRYIPPVRLVWIFLGVLIALGGAQAGPDGEAAMGAMLAMAVGLDLVIQFGRFGRKLRFPDAALAIGMFLVILIRPANVSLGSGSADQGIMLLAITAATITVRHLVRQNGRPWFNPTALGLTLGFFLFGLQVPWAVGNWVTSQGLAEQTAMIIFGIALVIRQRNTWRFPAFFFATVVPAQVLASWAVAGNLPDLGSAATWQQSVLPPLTLFYGFFMVSEPRTAPSAPKHMWRFAILVALLSVLLGVAWDYDPYLSPLSSIDPFLALFGGNLYAVLSRKIRLRAPAKASAPRSSRISSPFRGGAAPSPLFYGGFEIVDRPGPPEGYPAGPPETPQLYGQGAWAGGA